jgi:hypothetical protein
MPTFQWHKSCNVLSSGRETAVFGIRAARVISLLPVRFPIKIMGNSLFSKSYLLSGTSWYGLGRFYVQRLSKWVFFCLVFVVLALTSSF